MKLRGLFWRALVPPLDSPLSHVAYLGRRGHLRGLMRMAERWGWKASGPDADGYAVRIAGEWAGRELHIESGAAHLGAFGCHLSVAVRSKQELWPMLLSVGMEGTPVSRRKAAARGKCRNAQGGSHTFYVWPTAGRAAETVDVGPLKAALESGKAFLQPRTAVNAAGESVWFGKRSSLMMSETDEDLEAIIRWLDAIAGVMEANYSDGGGAASTNHANLREQNENAKAAPVSSAASAL